jgi:hypothetical protein
VIHRRSHKTGRVTTKQDYNIETDCTEMVYENVNCVDGIMIYNSKEIENFGSDTSQKSQNWKSYNKTGI